MTCEKLSMGTGENTQSKCINRQNLVATLCSTKVTVEWIGSLSPKFVDVFLRVSLLPENKIGLRRHTLLEVLINFQNTVTMYD